MNPRHLSIVLVPLAALSLAGFSPQAAPRPVDPPGVSAAAAPGREADLPPSQPPGPTDPAELEPFLDELMAADMEEHHIAGAAVSVVKDGQLFFAKGYGYANLEKGVLVDPERTIFRIGSVGKLFTWTAVMQLVEQGKLDLDADVNNYLDFRIPDTYPEPITLRHLMTHTSGFEDVLLEAAVSDVKDLIPAREWLASHTAARVFPPGENAGYSNFNAMLAGYIVARVSGQPYDQYIQEHILDPLGMVHSTARSPMPPDLRAYASEGYTYQAGAFHAFPDYFGQPGASPSGILQASVTDMARFMIAHLQDGVYRDGTIGEARILEEETARQMHSTQYTPDPRLLGTTFGFADLSDNGQRTLGHQGYAPPMHGLLLLMPDQNLGVYLVYNTGGAGELTTQHIGFQRAFFDHYYPPPEIEPIQPPADFAERAGRFVGSYREASSPHTTLLKIAGLYGGFEIRDPGDGTLLLAIKGFEWPFVEVGPLYFRQVNGPFHLLFRQDGGGRITRLDTDIMPQYTAVRLDWYETAGFNMALLVGCALVFLSVIPAGVIRARWNHRRDVRIPAPRKARAAYWIILGISLLNLVVMAGTMRWVAQPTELHSPLWILRVVLGLGVLSALLTVGALIYSVLAWKEGYWGVAYRSYFTLVTVAAVACVWFLNYWNLLGWRF